MITASAWLGVLVSVVATMALGMFWYSPVGFGKTWIKLQGWSKKDLDAMQKKAKDKGMASTWLLGILINAVWVFVLSLFVASALTLGEAYTLAFFLWFGFIVTTQLSAYIWEGKPFKLIMFNTAYNLASLLVAATILFYLH